jgi:hypothetical protein
MARTTTHVLTRVQDVAHTKDTGAGGHELREASRAFGADCDGDVAAFLDDEGVEQMDRHPSLASRRRHSWIPDGTASLGISGR